MGGDRRGTNYVQGSTNIADFAGSLAVGLGNRVEVFGAFLFDTRVNRDGAPVFANDARAGGIAARSPRVTESWTGNNAGDLYLGHKGQPALSVSRGAGGPRRPRHRQAADRQRGGGRQHGRPT